MGLARVGRGAGTGGAGGGGVRGWANAHLARVALGRVVHSLFSPATAHAHMAAIKSDTCVCVCVLLYCCSLSPKTLLLGSQVISAGPPNFKGLFENFKGPFKGW